MSATPQRKKEKEVSERKFDFRLEEESGASLAHNQINRNLCGILWQQLRGQWCEPFASDMPVYSKAKDGTYLPDIVVACGPEVRDWITEITDGDDVKRTIRKALCNPILVAEVWSDGNTASHKKEKLYNYQQITSLEHYLTIEQSAKEILHYYRNQDRLWAEEPLQYNIEAPEFSIDLGGVDVCFHISEIYDKVV
jgi:Uma2 family endonuclease